MNEPAFPETSPRASAMPMDYATLLSRLGDKDRATLERQVLAYEKRMGTASAQRWRSLACALMTLAPARARLAGSDAMRFYIPDGKYHQQVFALQALANGAFTVYAPDVLAEAVSTGLLSRRNPTEDGTTYHLADSDGILIIDAMDGKTPDQDAFFRDLTGWNHKAIRITLPAEPSEAQVGAAQQLCALAAAQWA